MAHHQSKNDQLLSVAAISRGVILERLLWLLMIAGFGVVYWIAGVWGGAGAFPGAFHGLRMGSSAVESNWQGALTAVHLKAGFACRDVRRAQRRA